MEDFQHHYFIVHLGLIYNLHAKGHKNHLHHWYPSPAVGGQELSLLLSTNNSEAVPQLGELCVTWVLILRLSLDEQGTAGRDMQDGRAGTEDPASTLSTFQGLTADYLQSGILE